MSFLRSAFAFLVAVLIPACCAPLAFGAQETAASASVTSPAILPQAFGGWQLQGATKTSANPLAADAANAGILKEYGFTDIALATYARDDGRTLKIRAARFADASGAFGAYTLYLQREMQMEQVGDQAASEGRHVLFYRGNILIDALFSQESAMSGAELRELAGVLPRPTSNAANLPPILSFMPRQGYIANTEKYAMGPAALAAFAPPVPLDMINFALSPEITLGHYSTSSGEQTLMLIYYPTPQLAIEQFRRIGAAHGVQFQSGIAGIHTLGSFFGKRTGPIIAFAAGASEGDAKALLGSVNYEAKVTWNERADNREVHDLYQLILNIVVLCGIVGGLAIIAGFAFGGIRVLAKRIYPDKIFDRPEQMEFISLRLTEVEVLYGEVPGNASTGEAEDRKSPGEIS